MIKTLKPKSTIIIGIISSLFLLLFNPYSVKADTQPYIYCLPENVKTYLSKQNIIIETTENINYYVSNGTVDACTFFYPSFYLIQIKPGKDERIIHELGHVIDCYGNNNDLFSLSSNENFKYIYLTERYNNTLYFYGNGTDNTQEYFAESVSQYIFNNENMKKFNPLTYEYISAILNSL